MSSTIPRDSHQRSHASALAARADALSTRIRAVTTPLYTVGGHTKPDAIGTGVLVAIANSRFLITAAHVLDWRLNQPLAAGVNNGLSQLDGDVGRIYAKSATGVADDPVDIGIVRLRGQQWNSIPESAFATWDELDLSLSTPRRHTYGLVGYPLTKQRSSFKGTTLTALAYEMAAIEAPRTVYKALTRDPGINLVLGFDKRRMWGPRGMVEAPDMQGVSGAGVWRFGQRLREAVGNPRLSAIAIEWHRRGRHKHILATRIHPILAGIGTLHPDLIPYVGGAA